MYKRNLRMKNSTLDRKNLIQELSPTKKKKILKEKDMFININKSKSKKKKKF